MGILKKSIKLFGGKENEVIDLRCEESRRAEAIGYSGQSLGSPEADSLVAELVQIARTAEFLSRGEESTHTYDEWRRHQKGEAQSARV